MFKHILVAVDGSATSIRGLKAAIGLAKGQQAAVDVVHVVDDMESSPTFDDGGYLPAEYIDMRIKQLRDNGRKVLVKADALARKEGVTVRTVLVEKVSKDVAHTILEQARKLKADMIVLGTHGRRGLRRIVVGSDAEAVVRESRVPVLLVRYEEPVARTAVALGAKRRSSSATSVAAVDL